MRFTLQTLLLCFVVVWSSMAAFGVMGFFLAFIFLAIVGYVHAAESKWQAIVFVAVIVLLVLCPLSAYLPPSRSPGPTGRCMNSLKQLEFALYNYHDEHGHFPPAYIADSNGKPMHSWRVLILPYLEYQPLYELYDFDEPWDGPNNSKLAAQRPELFACPADASTDGTTTTSYVAVVGPKTMWPGTSTVDVEAIPDGAGNTIHLVEVADSGIEWMEPRDLSFEEAVAGINPSSGSGISSRHKFEIAKFISKPGANVSFADGRAGSFANDVPADVLKALLTRDGNEKVDREKYDLIARAARERQRQRRIRQFAVVALVASVGLLFMRMRNRRETNAPGTAVPGR